jgi:hypothetical protein
MPAPMNTTFANRMLVWSWLENQVGSAELRHNAQRCICGVLYQIPAGAGKR